VKLQLAATGERSGTLYDFVALTKAIQESLEPYGWHLDLKQRISQRALNGKIVRALWRRSQSPQSATVITLYGKRRITGLRYAGSCMGGTL
jgi:hypothetical protein